MENMEVRNYITGQVEEEVYASTTTIAGSTTTPTTTENGRVRDGYDAVIVSIAADQTANVYAFIKINGKQYYSNGIYTDALPADMQETGLFIALKQGDLWELGFTNLGGGAATISYRLRIRLFKR